MNWKIVAGLILMVLFIGVCFFLGNRMVAEKPAEEGGGVPHVTARIPKATNTVSRTKRDKRDPRVTRPEGRGLAEKPRLNVPTEPPATAADKKGLDELQVALDEDNLEKVRTAAQELKGSSSPYVRGKIVESLRWFGQPAVVDLRGMLNDSDKEVATDASEGWLDAVKTIEDEEIKAKELSEGMTRISDLETLREAAMQLYELDDGLALQYTIPLISSSQPTTHQVGLEIYDHIVGESYTTPETAQRWIETWRREHPLEVRQP